MNRPHVQIDQPSCLESYRRALDALLPRLARVPGLVGVTLNGGMSRGYADALSEIDLTLFTQGDPALPVAQGITRVDGFLYDIKVEDYAACRARPWDMTALWDASYAQVLIDPSGRIEAMLAEKLAARPSARDAAGYLFDSWWHFRLAGDIWKKRGDAAQGHLVLNNAVAPLIAALFAVNGEWVPHEKWLVHFSRSLPWRPEGWTEGLEAALRVSAMDAADLARRQGALETLWRGVDRRACALCGWENGLSASQQQAYAALSALAQRGRMPLAAWQARFGAASLKTEPIFSLAHVADGQVVLDRERLLRAQPGDFYDWFYQVVARVREG